MNVHAFQRGLQVARSMAHRGHTPSSKERAMLKRAAETSDISIHRHQDGLYMATKENPKSVLYKVWTHAYRQENMAIAEALLQHEYKDAMAALHEESSSMMDVPQGGYRTKHSEHAYKPE